MAGTSNIEWTDATWNPIAGCSIVSSGCTNCYAMKMAHRIDRMSAGKPSHYHGTTKIVNGKAVWTGVVNAAPDHILPQPLNWKKPRRIFVNSMSDLFHEAVPDEVIDKVFAVMALCPQHTFQILTKRTERMRYYLTSEGVSLRLWRRFEDCLRDLRLPEHHPAYNSDVNPYDGFLPLPNVHLGVSCENQATVDERIPDLLATPAAVRFVSAEPLLGPIDFKEIDVDGDSCVTPLRSWTSRELEEMWGDEEFHPPQPKLDQIIVGGESGHGFRPMQIEWAEDIMRQCKEARTAFFFKQDSAFKSGQQGRASPALWASKQMVGE